MSNELELKDKEILELRSEVQRLRRVTLDLRESEDFSRSLFQATQTGMLIIQTETKQIMDANPAAAEILGCQVEDLVGHLTTECIACSGPSCNLLSPSDPAQGDSLAEMIHQDGHRIPVLRSVTALKGNNEGILLFGFLDITARQNAENKLKVSHQQLTLALEELQHHKNRIVQSEKLASIGQLAAGVAHEINNPVGYVTSNLGTISEYADTMKAVLRLYQELDQLPADNEDGRRELSEQIDAIRRDEDLEFILEDVENVMSESMEGVHRVAEIVQNLKSFAREDSSQRSLHDVNDGIEAMIKVVWNELKYRCRVEKDLVPVPPVEGHGGQINQVLMNMMVNASHAMPEEGGLLKLATALIDSEVEITITDNGSGMDEATLGKIFDPFFTTKDVGVGTGLGLSISHGIVQDHGGRIEVESHPGQGTTFRVYLPAATDLAIGSLSGRDPEEELIG
jgi:two-component system NtrC family sensor kinase